MQDQLPQSLFPAAGRNITAVRKSFCKFVFFIFFIPNAFLLADDQSGFLQGLIDAAPEGGLITIPPGSYSIANGLIPKFGQTIMAYGVTLKRANSSKAKIVSPAGINDTSITLDEVPPDWRPGDTIHLFGGNGIEDTSAPIVISAITSSVVTLTRRIARAFPVETPVRKVFTMIAPSIPISQETIGFKLLGMTIHGNRANNDENLYWYHNATVRMSGRQSLVRDCRFVEIPNECIVGSGMKVMACTFEGLNGSALHLSSFHDLKGEQFGTFFIGNYVRDVCQATDAKSGHAEGAITFSWNPGRLTITGNQFYNGREGVLGDLAYSRADHADSRYIVFSDNICVNFPRIMRMSLREPLFQILVEDNLYDRIENVDFRGAQLRPEAFMNDSDEDGIPALIEVALGLSTNEANQLPLQMRPVANGLEFSLKRSLASGASCLKVQISDDLENPVWRTVAFSANGAKTLVPLLDLASYRIEKHDEYDEYLFQLDLPLSEDKQQFFRLAASR